MTGSTTPGEPTTTPPNNTGGATTTTTPKQTSVPASTIDDPAQQVFLCDLTGVGYALGPTDPPTLNGTAVSGANATVDPTTGQWRVDFTLNSRGAKLFDEMAAKNVNKQVAIDQTSDIVLSA